MRGRGGERKRREKKEGVEKQRGEREERERREASATKHYPAINCHEDFQGEPHRDTHGGTPGIPSVCR